MIQSLQFLGTKWLYIHLQWYLHTQNYFKENYGIIMNKKYGTTKMGISEIYPQGPHEENSLQITKLVFLKSKKCIKYCVMGRFKGWVSIRGDNI